MKANLRLLKWKTPKNSANVEYPIEILETNRDVFIRNTQHPQDIAFMTREQWARFKEDIKADNYD